MALFPLALILTVLIHSSLQQGTVDIVRQAYSERVNFQLEQQITSYVRQEVTYKAYASYFGRADVALTGFQRFFQSFARTARKQALELTELVNERGGDMHYPIIQLKDACRYSIEGELAKGDITKPRAGQPNSARTTALICQFLLLDRKDTSHEKKAKGGKSDKDELKKRNPPKSRRGRSKRWAWPLPLFSSDQATATNTVQREPSRKSVPVNTLEDRSSWQDGLFGVEDSLAIERTAQQELLPIIAMTRKGSDRDPQIYHELRFYLDKHVKSTYQVAELVRRLQRHQDLDTYELEEFLLDKELEH